MTLTIDPEIAAALAPMAQSGFTPPAVGDIAGRRAPSSSDTSLRAFCATPGGPPGRQRGEAQPRPAEALPA